MIILFKLVVFDVRKLTTCRITCGIGDLINWKNRTIVALLQVTDILHGFICYAFVLYDIHKLDMLQFYNVSCDMTIASYPVQLLFSRGATRAVPRTRAARAQTMSRGTESDYPRESSGNGREMPGISVKPEHTTP